MPGSSVTYNYHNFFGPLPEAKALGSGSLQLLLEKLLAILRSTFSSSLNLILAIEL